MLFQIPLYLAGVFANVGSIAVLNLVSGPSSYLENNFIEPCRAEDIDMVTCISTSARYCWNWAMGELKGDGGSKTRFKERKM